jgi:hypothetical protein
MPEQTFTIKLNCPTGVLQSAYRTVGGANARINGCRILGNPQVSSGYACHYRAYPVGGSSTPTSSFVVEGVICGSSGTMIIRCAVSYDYVFPRSVTRVIEKTFALSASPQTLMGQSVDPDLGGRVVGWGIESVSGEPGAQVQIHPVGDKGLECVAGFIRQEAVDHSLEAEVHTFVLLDDTEPDEAPAVASPPTARSADIEEIELRFSGTQIDNPLVRYHGCPEGTQVHVLGVRSEIHPVEESESAQETEPKVYPCFQDAEVLESRIVRFEARLCGLVDESYDISFFVSLLKEGSNAA